MSVCLNWSNDTHRYATIAGMKYSAPFIHQGASSRTIMRLVAACLLFIILAQAWFISLLHLKNTIVILLAALVFEYVLTTARKRNGTLLVRDGSIVVAGLILAYGMPPAAPLHVLITAAFIMTCVKHMYGGIGTNLFNPAMTAYACVLVMFPTVFSHWPHLLRADVDAVSQATPLFTADMSSGEQSLLLWLNGIVVSMGGLLVLLRIIKWHVPACVIAGFLSVLFTYTLTENKPFFTLMPFHLLSGALLFAAFFVATDPVELPRTQATQMLYAAIIGALIALIRLYGSYPEGVAFAVLLGNMTSPLLNEIEQRRRGVVIK